MIQDATMTHPTLTEKQDLGLALLVAEFGGGAYQPIAPVSTLAEARELAQNDFLLRRRQLATCEEAPCPSSCRLWKRDERGTFAAIADIEG